MKEKNDENVLIKEERPDHAGETVDSELDGKSSTSTPSGSIVSATSDNMSVLLDCPDPGIDLDSFLETVEKSLEELGIPTLPERPLLEDKIRQAPREDGKISGLVLLEGAAPVPPVDGRIEWTEDFFATGFAVENETRKVDYWERLENLSVANGQVLAYEYPAQTGTAGRNVFDHELPVETPCAARISCGPNVGTREEDGKTVYFATMAGRIRWANGVLAVDETYTINGNVGLETGNISHPGAVLVKGDVKNGATIEAEGDVVVSGLVEPCDIFSNGSLTVAGGIVGREGNKIELNGAVHAKYVLDANLVACEDVVVTNEIAHSRVMTRGEVLVSRGRIVGSDVTAHRGITVAQAGADSGAVTTLEPGTDFSLARETEAFKQEISRLEIEIKNKDKQISRVSSGGDSHKKELDDLTSKRVSLEQALEVAQTALYDTVRHSKKERLREVRVLKRIHPGTVFKIGSKTIKIEKLLEGPRKFELVEGRIVEFPLKS